MKNFLGKAAAFAFTILLLCVFGTGAYGQCTDATKFVTGQVRVGTDGFVIGTLTNNSNQTLYVMYTFKQNGRASKSAGGAVTIRSGQRMGGEGAGIWATGVDTNPPEIYWYAVLQSDIDQGKSCGSAW